MLKEYLDISVLLTPISYPLRCFKSATSTVIGNLLLAQGVNSLFWCMDSKLPAHVQKGDNFKLLFYLCDNYQLEWETLSLSHHYRQRVQYTNIILFATYIWQYLWDFAGTPHTGRTHQIRVHLQYLGHPIINDPLYNSDVWGPERGKGGNYGKSEEQVIFLYFHIGL